MNDIDKLLNEYAEQFDEAFPVYSFGGSEEELEQTLKTCIKMNEPYHAEYDDKADY